MPYDISIKRVALAGGSGKVGNAILEELLKSGLFEITILTRQSSDHSFPSNVKVFKVDYSDPASLVKALNGQDALVSAVAGGAVSSQRLLIDAAVKAGIKRIVPSEFGCDLKHHKAKGNPFFAEKIHIENYLDELAISGATSYTLLFTGIILDLGLRDGVFFDFKDKKADIFDGGDHLISTVYPLNRRYQWFGVSCVPKDFMTRLSTVGKAVRRILTHPRETADRAVWVKDIDVSQNDLVRLAEALTPGEKWVLKDVDSASVEAECLKQMEKKEDNERTAYDLLKCAIFSAAYGNQFEHVHNSTLGIKGMTRPDLEELVASIFGRKRS